MHGDARTSPLQQSGTNAVSRRWAGLASEASAPSPTRIGITCGSFRPVVCLAHDEHSSASISSALHRREPSSRPVRPLRRSSTHGDRSWAAANFAIALSAELAERVAVDRAGVARVCPSSQVTPSPSAQCVPWTGNRDLLLPLRRHLGSQGGDCPFGGPRTQSSSQDNQIRDGEVAEAQQQCRDRCWSKTQLSILAA